MSSQKEVNNFVYDRLLRTSMSMKLKKWREIGVANAWPTLTAQEKKYLLDKHELTVVEIAQLKVRYLL
jgi:hypothetical protein